MCASPGPGIHADVLHGLRGMGIVAAAGLAGMGAIAAAAAVSPAVAGVCTIGYAAVAISSVTAGVLYYHPLDVVDAVAAAAVAVAVPPRAISLQSRLFAGRARRISSPGLRARRLAAELLVGRE